MKFDICSLRHYAYVIISHKGKVRQAARNSYLNKRELVILIKPTIIRNESSWKDDLFETQNRMQQLDPRLAQPARP